MPKLPNAPLQEVIFEVRWALMPGSEGGMMTDQGFELASGRLSTLVESRFPLYKRIVPPEIPEQLLHYKVIHQYWTSENQWPVMQLGPGIFTVNCTEQAYEWEDNFRSLIREAIEWLNLSYKRNLDINFASLRYIDAIKLEDYVSSDLAWDQFIAKYFNFSYENQFDAPGMQKQIQINQTFALEDGSDLQIQFSDGFTNNKRAFIWQTVVLKKQLFTAEDIFLWADDAHRATHHLFMAMIKPELYASFKGENHDKD